MKKRYSEALNLSLKEVFDPEFVKAVIDRKVPDDNAPRAKLLRSQTSKTLVRKTVLYTFVEKKGNKTRLAELASYTPQELRRTTQLGPKTLRWLEEYLFLLGVVLPGTNSVYGMSPKVQDFLNTF